MLDGRAIMFLMDEMAEAHRKYYASKARLDAVRHAIEALEPGDLTGHDLIAAGQVADACHAGAEHVVRVWD